ncbi:MAG: NAD(P)-dependent oxidoreductase, partial [Chloroflexota bacterium]
GVGYEMVDVPALTAAGVALCITRDAVRRPVASAILTFILALSTRLRLKDRLIREGRWAERARHHGIGLVGKTLGLIGVGNIGHEVFRLAAPLEMKHIAYDPFVRPQDLSDVTVQMVDMDTVLRESDFMSICCPLNEQTHHLIGEAELRKMKPSSFLINMSRGPVVDESALIRALQKGWIQGAGLDVFEQEPIALDNPLLAMDNVILAPHSLAWLGQTFTGMWDDILGQMNDILHGDVPSGLVNADVLDSPAYQWKLKQFVEAIG